MHLAHLDYITRHPLDLYPVIIIMIPHSALSSRQSHQLLTSYHILHHLYLRTCFAQLLYYTFAGTIHASASPINQLAQQLRRSAPHIQPFLQTGGDVAGSDQLYWYSVLIVHQHPVVIVATVHSLCSTSYCYTTRDNRLTLANPTVAVLSHGNGRPLRILYTCFTLSLA